MICQAFIIDNRLLTFVRLYWLIRLIRLIRLIQLIVFILIELKEMIELTTLLGLNEFKELYCFGKISRGHGLNCISDLFKMTLLLESFTLLL